MTRILELAEQAKKSVPQGILTPDKWIEEYNKIFAKLIIQECADVAGFNDKDAFVSLRIKEHFGVNHE